jgi:hypothetical protein
MAQYPITLPDDGLNGLFEHILGLATGSWQTEPDERSVDRLGYRNGTRPHPVTLQVGPLVLRGPACGAARCPPSCLPAIDAESKPWCGP